MTFGPVFPAVFSKIFTTQIGGGYILLDNFTGTGALTSHTPDIFPAGSSWAIIGGTFGNLSGGYLPYTSGNNGKALINIGVSDFELTYSSKYLTLTSDVEHGGIMFRSSSTGADFYAVDYSYSSGVTIYANIPGSVLFDAVNQPQATRHKITVANGNYYTWKVIAKGNQIYVLDSTGAVMTTAFSAVKTANTYIGPYNLQGSKATGWDFIQVTPLVTAWKYFSVMGDSISDNPTEWPGMVAARYSKLLYLNNHAVSGSTIAGHMDSQTDLCETDAADFTIIALGTNDSTNIQTKYYDNLLELWGTLGKPIYCMNVLNKTPDTNRANTNGYIAAAIASAQAGGVGVTLWDTEGWIDPATDTSDGLHPTAAGEAKIANQILTRLP